MGDTDGTDAEWGIAREVNRIAKLIDRITEKLEKISERTSTNETAITLLKFQVMLIGAGVSIVVTPIVVVVVNLFSKH